MKAKLIGAVLLAFLSLSSFNSSSTPISPQEETKTSSVNIKIGYIGYTNFIVKDESTNTFSGYAVSYMNKLNKILNWNVSYVTDTWENIVGGTSSVPYEDSLISKGDIDFVMQAQMTDEREAHYDFSSYAIGEESGVLYSKLDDSRFYYGDYDQLGGATIGVLEGSYQTEAFNDFMSKNYPSITYSTVTYATQKELEDELNKTDSSLDGIAIGSLSYETDFKVIGKFSSAPFYFMYRKNMPYATKLNEALDIVRLEDPNFQTNLFDEYYGNITSSGNPNFTRSEVKFIDDNKNKKFKISCLPNRLPISYEDNGETTGMFVDAMKLVSEKTGLQFEYDFTSAGQSVLSFLKDNPDGIVGGASLDNPQFDSADYLTTNSILDGSIVFVGRAKETIDTTSSLKVALPKSYKSLISYIQKSYPNFILNTTDYSTTEECLKAVMNKKEDIMLQNLYIVSPLLSNPHYDSLEIIPSIVMTERLCLVSLSNAENYNILFSVINKGISVIKSNEINQIVIDYTITNAYTMTFSDFVFKYRIPLIIILVFTIIIAVGVVFLLLMKNKHQREIMEKNDQLVLAYKEAQSANVAKSQFLSRMSHEIRTPLNAIIGLSTIGQTKAKEDSHSSSDADYFTKIENSSKVLLSLVNDILDMSAIEANKIKIAEEDFDIKEVITYLSSTYYNLCKSKGIDFSISTDISIEELIGDSLRTNQILLNLTSNAYKFTPKGGKIRINISQSPVTNGIIFMEYDVSDNGEGMDQDMLKRLFVPFEQESATTAQKHGGSGLGLSIVKNLVDLMHGSIRVESAKGKGTTFFVNIPYKVSSVSPCKVETSTSFEGIKALVVDDDKDSLEYTSFVLKRLGVVYDLASNSSEAISMLNKAREENSPYSICLLDWKMPGIDGLTLTKKIRKEYDNSTPVIIISAYDTGAIKEDAIKAGANNVLSKPIFQSSIFNLLVNLKGKGPFKIEDESYRNYDFSSKKVLIAEDNEINMEIAVELLKAVKFNVIDQAKDGKEVVDKYLASKEGYYDLILMDVQMPKLDGYEATEKIRSSSRKDSKSIIIIAMTANAFADDISRSLNSGMNGHISKPIDINMMYKTLARSLSKKDKKK